MQYAQGYVDPSEYYDDTALYNAIVKYNSLEKLVNYCFEHATGSANPIQDLVDKGLIDTSYQGQDCRTVRESLTNADAEAARLLANYTAHKYGN